MKQNILTHTNPRELPRMAEHPQVDYLEHMFELQGKLMTRYVAQGSIPPFPADLGDYNNQQVMKALLFAFVTEMAEMSEEYHQIMYPVINEAMPNYWEISKRMVNLNEEIADCFSFLMELMILANMGSADMLLFYEQQMKAENIMAFFKSSNALETAFRYARNALLREDANVIGHYSSIPVRLPEEIKNVFKAQKEYTIVAGSTIVNLDRVLIVESALWGCTFAATSSARLLRNKPWKMKQEDIDVDAYQLSLAKLFVEFIRLITILGAGHTDTYYNYCMKNSICHLRLDEKY